MSKKRSRDPVIQEIDSILDEIRHRKQLYKEAIRVCQTDETLKSEAEAFEKLLVRAIEHEWQMMTLRRITISKIIVDRKTGNK